MTVDTTLHRHDPVVQMNAVRIVCLSHVQPQIHHAQTFAHSPYTHPYHNSTPFQKQNNTLPHTHCPNLLATRQTTKPFLRSVIIPPPSVSSQDSKHLTASMKSQNTTLVTKSAFTSTLLIPGSRRVIYISFPTSGCDRRQRKDTTKMHPFSKNFQDTSH